MDMKNIIIWNVRGIGTSRKRLKHLIQSHDIGIVIILEPWAANDKADEYRRKLNMDKLFTSDSGKIWIYWKEDFEVQITSTTEQAVTIETKWYGKDIILTAIYAKCNVVQRRELWNMLEDQSRGVDKPWLVGGDFNTILDCKEKIGGRMPNLKAMEEFQIMCIKCALEDYQVSQASFSWTNGRVREKLDRLLINVHWSTQINDFEPIQLNRISSDHNPYILKCKRQEMVHKSSFRYQAMWELHDNFMDMVQKCWEAPLVPYSRGMYGLLFKLKRLKKELKIWNKEVFGNIFSQIKRIEEKAFCLEQEVDLRNDPEDVRNLEDVYRQHQELMNKEEHFWKQKAGCNWLIDGDRNTKFFHAVVMKKRKQNFITSIRGEDGQTITDMNLIQQSAVKYFSTLLTTDNIEPQAEIFQCIPQLINTEDNQMMTMIPTMEEVKQVVFSIPDTSSAGPDGYSSRFYQTCWPIIKEDLMNAVEDFFKGRKMPQAYKATSLFLIPKKEDPEYWTDYRPLSLCNVHYKIITKLLNVRLAGLLPKLISQNQTGFTPQRDIAHNILLAQEMVEQLDRKCRGGNMIIKLDMMKAYDRVEWKALFMVLRKFGFGEELIQMIENAITGSSYSILLNGELRGYFNTTRGIRQGDPISPSLFILLAELLSRGLNGLYETSPNLNYRYGGRISVSHLAFADDIIIFTNGLKESLSKLTTFLHSYERTSGQKINFKKSCYVTSHMVNMRLVGELSNLQKQELPIYYLGAPLYKGRQKIILFEGLLNKIRKRLMGWEHKLLSAGGRLTLIRSVLTSMPIHLIKTINCPVTIQSKIEKLFNAFFFGR